jgi:hypothetical protein
MFASRMALNSLAAVALAASLLASPALHAQAPQTARASGIVERIDGSNLTLKTAQGNRAVTLSSDASFFALVKATLADIKPGVFVGVGASPQADGSQQAIRVMIFPESMRGLGEGHRPWDRPGTTMTNATVENAVTGVDGQVLNVKYKGGEKKIVIKSDAAILTYVATDRNELKPGANVTVSGTSKPDNAIEANRVTISRGGVTL